MIGPPQTSRCALAPALRLTLVVVWLALGVLAAPARAQESPADRAPPAAGEDAAGAEAPADTGGAQNADGGIGTGGTSGAGDAAAAEEEEADPIKIAEQAREPTTWRTALPRFWKYFGWPGVLAVALVLASVVWMLRFTLTRRGGRLVWGGAVAALFAIALLLTTRTTGSIDLATTGVVLLVLMKAAMLLRRVRIEWPVVILAIAAFSVGEWNSSRVSAIDVDRSAEEARMRQAREAEQQSKPGGNIAEGRTAVELSEEDKRLLDEAGEDDEPDNEYEAAAQQDQTPLYKQRGKQQRDPDRLTSDGDDEDASYDADAGLAERRALPPGDVTRANRWDVVMLGATRWAPWIGLLVVLAAYLDRFNRGAGARAPLPISNRGIDAVFLKPMVAFCQDDRPTLAATLREIAQKGESFIYLGPDDPLADESALRRLMLLPNRGVWRLRKAVMPADEAEQRDAYVFESAWFRRLCFIVICDAPPAAFVDRLIERLAMRKVTKAVARRTLNLVFDDAGVPDPDRLRELARLARRANVKLIVRAGEQTGDLPDELFDEVIDGGESLILQPAAPQPSDASAKPGPAAGEHAVAT